MSEVDVVDACIADGEDWMAAEPSSDPDLFCRADGFRCSKHKSAKKKRPAVQLDNANANAIQLIAGRMCMGNSVVVDGEVSIHSVLRGPGGTTLRLFVKRNDGEVIEADMKPDTLEQPALLNAWLTKVAAVNGRVTKQNRQALKDHLFAQIEACGVSHQVASAGYVEAFDVLAFANGWVDAIGVVHRGVSGARGAELLVGGPGNGTGQRKTLHLQAGALGSDVPSLPEVLPQALMDEAHLPADRRVSQYGGPRGDAQHDARMALQRFIAAARENYGDYTVAIGLGYMMAHAVSPRVFRDFDRFPHLYITGPTQTGKDTLARYLVGVACGNERAAIQTKGTTPKLVRNGLGQNSLIPMWINELRGNPDEQWLDGFIRAVYDRQGSAITNIEQDRVEFHVRRSMLLVGEAVAGSTAEFSRYVELHLKPVANPLGQDAVDAQKVAARSAWATLLADWHRAAPTITESVRLARAELMKGGSDERRAFAWGCAAAGLAWMYHPGVAVPSAVLPAGAWREIVARCSFAQTRSKDAGSFARFWEAAAIAKRDDMALLQTKNDRYVWLAGADSEIMCLAASKLIARTEQVSRMRMPDATLVRNEMVRLPCFIEQSEEATTTQRGTRSKVSVMKFDLRHPSVEESFPGWLLEAAHMNDMGVFNESAWDKNRAEREKKK